MIVRNDGDVTTCRGGTPSFLKFHFLLTVNANKRNTSCEVMSDLMGKIRCFSTEAAHVLRQEGLTTDSDIRSLTREDLCELFPGKRFKFRKAIFEIIHKQRPINDLLEELKGFIPQEYLSTALTNNGVLVEYFHVLKSVKNQVDVVQTFLDAHIDLLENISKKKQANPEPEDSLSGKSEPHTNQAVDHQQGAHDNTDASVQNVPDSDQNNGRKQRSLRNYIPVLSTQSLQEVKYKMVIKGKTFGADDQLMEQVKSCFQDRAQLTQSSEDHHIVIVFCPITSRVGTDVEAAMADESVSRTDKPVILVLMHHSHEARHTTSMRTWTSKANVVLHRIFAVNELSGLSVRKLHHISTSHCQKVSAIKPSAHRSGLKALPQTCLYQLVCDMQPASISYGKETTAVSSDGDEDEGGDGGEGVVGQEGGTEELKIMMSPGQVDAVSMEVQQGAADNGASTVSTSTGPNEKKTKRKMRRERKKLMKEKLQPADTQDNFMSELPFALTSPTAWKELGFSNLESTQKKRKRKRGDSGGRVDSEEDGDKKKKKKESKRPNYFVSIPITNTEISSAVTEVQEAVLQQEPLLAKAMIPVPTLHITLLVTHLANQEQIDLAATVLTQVEPSLAELLGGRDLVLPFSGIGHFRKEVVFVGLAPGQHRHTLDSLAELLRSRFEEQGLLQGDSRGFEPHLTIMKLSRASKLRSQGIKRVDPALYSSYTNKFFGDQTVERVDLCSMLKKKQQDGYYHTETSLQLGGRRRSEPDEAELLRVSRRLVEDAVNRALQQYKQETLQNGGGPNATAVQLPENTEETATKTDTTANATTDNRK
ncbi:A-kinase anchor protein 7-like protein [Lates japonicus]|uniref:A-kinase anchor protein 7-like protein n=1 Tax=Lates japonicus TaxID=270547 RepID=A0AAD3R8L1_LATJO|nr:A-kinase anchor protein 7-like protein [Lates japonicus]